jgi:pimeloyl-ACP methyl ester carboxylesterase
MSRPTFMGEVCHEAIATGKQNFATPPYSETTYPRIRGAPGGGVERHQIENGAGWALEVVRHATGDGPPVVLLPGYGMNAFILGYHPSGPSMLRVLAAHGREVWTVHLAGQGGSARQGRAQAPTLTSWSTRDLPAAIEHIVARSGQAAADVIGCSLGGSVAYAALASGGARVRHLVTLGAPLRWVDVNPAVKLAFRSRRVAGAVPIVGTRAMARRVFPFIAARAPWALGMYVNAAHVPASVAATITATVDDPQRSINRDLASWLRSVDLCVDGTNVTTALAKQRGRLLVVMCNRDGIVPDASARAAVRAWGGDVDVLEVGDDDDWYAHADLYLAPEAPERVFEPIARWLAQAERWRNG